MKLPFAAVTAAGLLGVASTSCAHLQMEFFAYSAEAHSY